MNHRTRNRITNLIVGGLALLGAAQAQPPAADNPFAGSGSVTSQRVFQRPIREGNVVKGTEFFTITYEGSWELERTDETDDKRKPECNRTCLGKKHASHDECDDSCDRLCSVRNHRFSFSGHTDYLGAAMSQAEADADDLVRLTGADPWAANWTSFITKSLSNAKRMSERVRSYVVPCWNTKPCNHSTRYYGVRKYVFRVMGSVYEDGYYMSGGVKTPYPRRFIGQHARVVANVWLPETDPFATAYTPFCKCKPAKIEKPKPREDWPEEIFDDFWFENGRGEIIGGYPMDGVKVRIVGSDLNRIHLIVENGTPEEVIFVAGGGTLLDSSDDATQDMVILVTTRIKVGPGETKEGDARAGCVEMNKREPTSATTYSVHPEGNPTLRDLAAITQAERFRGPHDQARVWIVTDHCPFSEIGKHLLPGPSAGSYLNALYDVSRADGIDILDKAYAPCLEANLLAGTTAKPDAVRWLVQTLDERDPKALVRFAEDKCPEMAAKFADKIDDIDVAHLATLAKTLVSCDSKEGRLAGLMVLLKAVPAGKREAVIKKGGLDQLLIPIAMGDSEEQEKTLEVVDVYAHKPAQGDVARLAMRASSDTVRNKADQLAKKLGG